MSPVCLFEFLEEAEFDAYLMLASQKEAQADWSEERVGSLLVSLHLIFSFCLSISVFPLLVALFLPNV